MKQNCTMPSGRKGQTRVALFCAAKQAQDFFVEIVLAFILCKIIVTIQPVIARRVFCAAAIPRFAKNGDCPSAGSEQVFATLAMTQVLNGCKFSKSSRQSV